MMIIYALLLLLTGCASLTDRYPQTCDLTQPDKAGPGYTVGTFPCKLQHYEGKKKP